MTGDKYHLVELPMGWMVLLGGKYGLKRASLKPTPDEAIEDLGSDLDSAEDDPDAFTGVIECLHRYAEGDMAALDEIELDFSGVTPFFSAAWHACRTIPAGETRSYAWLAVEAGSPLAVRAAGQAMARNRFSLIVPCHRVIASDGGLGGYGGGGLGVKAKLLQMELGEQDR
ncbi:MAG: cysteine methyltransferase [Chloroflexi bacterium]|jgi:methylated-DNA-[protein]-cysteine S-methyltransferase|nr:cysteine methyltransferase [Chloroflexota bacterium]MDP6497541.1 MGMT family protein [Dehalococcoidia bacterium]MQG54675.1 MGMT family protein [SAR202 cluster bacterium]|tara:strand:- start:8255 stop:8767 length:513 start_codon:yes stop_codon:yes gene_type:complete